MSWTFTLTNNAASTFCGRKGNVGGIITRAYASPNLPGSLYAAAKMYTFNGYPAEIRPATTDPDTGRAVYPIVVTAEPTAYTLHSIGIYATLSLPTDSSVTEVLLAVGRNEDGIDIPASGDYSTFAYQINVRLAGSQGDRSAAARQIGFGQNDWAAWAQGGNTFVVPRGVSTIAGSGMSEMKGVTIYLPNSVTTIEPTAFAHTDGAVINCEFSAGAVGGTWAQNAHGTVVYNVPYPD